MSLLNVKEGSWSRRSLLVSASSSAPPGLSLMAVAGFGCAGWLSFLLPTVLSAWGQTWSHPGSSLGALSRLLQQKLVASGRQFGLPHWHCRISHHGYTLPRPCHRHQRRWGPSPLGTNISSLSSSLAPSGVPSPFAVLPHGCSSSQWGRGPPSLLPLLWLSCHHPRV